MKKQNPASLIHLLSLSLLALTASSAFGQSAAISYQGRLTEGGRPVNGLYDMQFKLFPSDVAGAPLGNTITIPSVRATEGLFTVTLDFGGVAIFDGSPRFLEIAISRAGSPFTRLDPRQQLASVPYAIKSINAATAATALNVASGSVVKSLNNLKDDVTLAAGPNATITRSGNTLTIDSKATGGGGGSGLWSLNGADAYYNGGNVGIGTSTPTPGYRLEVNGATVLRPANGFITFGSPNAELGLSINPNLLFLQNPRADLRFDGSILKLVAGAGGIPPPENGIAITTAGNVGIGTASPTLGYRLDVNGSTRLVPGGSGGGVVAFGNPNSETGMTISGNGNNRADLRFDGSVLKLVATAAAGPPPAGNGIAITTRGNVGIGTTTPIAKLQAETSEAGKIAVYGIASSTVSVGVYGSATGASSVGVEGYNPTGSAVHAEGNATQARDKGGFVKAMAYIDPFLLADRYVVRSYNSQPGATIKVRRLFEGDYLIDFGFNVEDRFFSVTAREIRPFLGTIDEVSGNQVRVFFQDPDREKIDRDTRFYIIVY